MKKGIFVYIVIGMLCAPFIYFDNALAYRPARSDFYRYGQAIGGAMYWPSYIFSIQPTIDSESFDSFESSLMEIVNYRNDKLYTGQRSNSHGLMVYEAVMNCALLEAGRDKDMVSFARDIFNKNINIKEAEKIRSNVMQMLDGYDFADIVEAGADCSAEVNESLTNAAANQPVESSLEFKSEGADSNFPQQNHADEKTNGLAEDATRQAAIEYEAKWNAIQQDPSGFIEKCESQNPSGQSDASCDSQLQQLEGCMNKPSAKAQSCFSEVFEGRY